MSDAAAEVRKIRSEHFGPRPKPTTIDVPAGLLEAPATDTAEQQRFEKEMEQGAHRDTLERLIAEKDQTIASLRDHLADVRARLESAETELAMRKLPEFE